jgi:hypothetical protein
MAEGAGTSQSSDYQRAVASLAKRDDGARVGALPLPRKPSAQFGKAARGWLFAVVGLLRFGAFRVHAWVTRASSLRCGESRWHQQFVADVLDEGAVFLGRGVGCDPFRVRKKCLSPTRVGPETGLANTVFLSRSATCGSGNAKAAPAFDQVRFDKSATRRSSEIPPATNDRPRHGACP